MGPRPPCSVRGQVGRGSPGLTYIARSPSAHSLLCTLCNHSLCKKLNLGLSAGDLDPMTELMTQQHLPQDVGVGRGLGPESGPLPVLKEALLRLCGPHRAPGNPSLPLWPWGADRAVGALVVNTALWVRSSLGSLEEVGGAGRKVSGDRTSSLCQVGRTQTPGDCGFPVTAETSPLSIWARSLTRGLDPGQGV